ncbi:MAG: hypothetical protein ATN35_08845 [Epulopiscium sp. Nele67-Bin004]|nr:MAG: hypothetical protein ATN35_08845 [Epulopiscium sp. Nele67-Bin004]
MSRKYLFISDSLEDLQRAIRHEKKDQFKRVYEMCRVYKAQELDKEHPDKSITFMSMGAMNLSMAYLLTEQEQYLEEAKRWIFAAVDYPHWGNKFLVDVDLSASWLMFGLSLSYDWLRDALTEEERIKLRDKLVLQADRMYKFKKDTEHLGDGEWSIAYWQNHNWINMAGLAAAGYVLRDEVPRGQEWIDDAAANFEKVYNYMADDGSNYEGVVYWRYGVIWLYVYADLVKQQEGQDYFKSCSFLKETFFYRLYQAAPNLEEIINFGDCHDRRSGHSVALYYKVASEYNNGYAQHLAKTVSNDFLYREGLESKVKPGILPEAAFELLWYNPTIEEKTFDDLPLIKHFDDLGLIVIRDSWEKDAMHFSFKCGQPGGKKQWRESWKIQNATGLMGRGLSHQHADNNSFIIHAHDTFLTIDEGYNRTVKAKEQSVLTVDGVGYRGENVNNIWKFTKEDEVAELLHFVNENGITYFAGDAHKSYADELELTKYIRNVIYTGGSHFYIIDEYDSTKDHTYRFNLQTEVIPQEVEAGVLEYKNGPGKMKLYTTINDENNLDFHMEKTYVKAFMSAQEPENFCEINMDTLCLENADKAKTVELLNVVTIADAFDDYKETVEAVSEGNTQGYKVNDEVVLFARNGKITYGDITAEAKLVAVTPSAILVVEGTSVTIGGKEVFKNDTIDTVVIQGV